MAWLVPPRRRCRRRRRAAAAAQAKVIQRFIGNGTVRQSWSTARRRRLLRLRLADRRHDHPRHLGCTGLRSSPSLVPPPSPPPSSPSLPSPYAWRCSSALCLFMTAFTLDAAVLALAHALECAPSRLATAGGAGAGASPPDPSFRLRPHMTADLLPMPPPNLPPPHHPCRHRPRRRSLSCAVRRSCTPGLSCAAGLATLQLAVP